MSMKVFRTYLELASSHQLRPSRAPRVAAEITRLAAPTAAEYLELYSRIGGPWQWFDRLAWSESQMRDYLARAGVHVFAASVGNRNAGYFELVQHPDDIVEIMYFGLDREFIGLGLGGWMLTRAVKEAFALGAAKVILNTCTLDAPQALPNYLARGFVIVREESYELPTPAPPPSP
jgi:GNAT superfamily N-acetyltransferase